MENNEKNSDFLPQNPGMGREAQPDPSTQIICAQSPPG